MPECLYVCYVHTVFTKRQKRVSNSLDIDLQEAVSHVMWVLGIESRSSVRTTTTLNCRTISTVPLSLLKAPLLWFEYKNARVRRGGTSKGLLGHDGSAFMNGSLMKNELPLPLLHLLPLPSCFFSCSSIFHHDDASKKFLLEVGPLTLNFLASRTVRNQSWFFPSHLVSAILL